MFKRRKKHPKLPNGFGSIRYLGAGRRNPYAVHPPGALSDDTGLCVRPKAIAYASDYLQGMQILMAYHSNTLTDDFLQSLQPAADASSEAIQAVLASYSRLVSLQMKQAPEAPKMTFAEVYEKYIEYKQIGKDGKAPALSTISGYKAAFLKFQSIHDAAFEDLRFVDLQEIINTTKTGYGTKKSMIKLLNQLGAYGKKYLDMSVPQYGGFEILDKDDTEHGVPFNLEEIALFGSHKGDFAADTLYLLCYTGHRINELRVVEYDKEDNCLIGGNKNKTGRQKVVPVHPAITDIVTKRFNGFGGLNPYSQSKTYSLISEFLKNNGIYECLNAQGQPTHHTPHDCRHTFSMLCDHYGVDDRSKKRLIGHTFTDITNSVYGHAMLEDLRGQIGKIETL